MTPRGPRVGIKDVARLAGVSVGTVSHVINRPERVSEKRRTAVLTAIDELGYVPNHAARQLKVGSSRLIGYLFPNPLNPYFSNLALGIQTEAERRDLNVLAATSHGSSERRRRYLSLFEQQRARGIIVSPKTAELSEEWAVAQRGTPVVLASAHDPSNQLCSVSCDDLAGGRLAIDHLVGAGRRRIAVITAAGRSAADQRWLGAEQAAAGYAGDGVAVEWLPVSEVSVDAGNHAAQTLLARPPAERPDAIFASSDLLALGVLHALVIDDKVSVPNDIAVIGYDNLAFTSSAIIPLTTIEQHERRMGELAVGLLEDEFTEVNHHHRQVRLEPVLVVRDSSR